MKKWEYQTIILGSKHHGSINDKLIESGKQGWELVSTSFEPSTSWMYVFLKREKVDELKPFDGD